MNSRAHGQRALYPNDPNDADNAPILLAKGVSRYYAAGGQTVRAVDSVSMELFAGEMVVLMGRSGSGKTTLLNLLGGLDRPTAGEVFFQGREASSLSGSALTKRLQAIGFVFQSFGLLPLLSAYENVELPLRIASVRRSERDARTKEALETVGMAHRLKHRPYELSGGEQQRVAIARAIVGRPSLILADEPTAELDSTAAKSVFDLMRDLVHTRPVAVLVATHDRLALAVAHRVLQIRDGSLVEE